MVYAAIAPKSKMTNRPQLYSAFTYPTCIINIPSIRPLSFIAFLDSAIKAAYPAAGYPPFSTVDMIHTVHD